MSQHQLHESFFFFRYPVPGDIDLITILRDAALGDVAERLTERAVAPKSVSLLVEPTEIVVCIGYANDAAYDVSFAVTEIGTAADPEPVLSDAMASAADANTGSGGVLCHDILTVGGKLYAVLMTKH